MTDRADALRTAFYAGRNDEHNRDPRRAYADQEMQAKYDWGRQSIRMDDALDADTEWDRD